MTNSTIDIKDFRRALGQFPTGVTIITTKDKSGEPVGVTASSFNTVSIDPPLVLWSVDKGAYSAAVFSDAEHFSINVLGKDQVALSNRFASRGEDKFSGIPWKEGEGGSPIFEDCAAQFECKTWNVYEGGDHLIIVGEVLNYGHSDSTQPLVFARGSYAQSMQIPASMNQNQVKLPEDGFLSDYLLYLLRMAFTKYTNRFYPKLASQFEITPEEWRVLTLLADHDPMKITDLGSLAMQPEEVFKATAEYMQSSGHIVIDGSDNTVSLTDSGKELTANLYTFAKEDEAEMLKSISDERASELKSDLRSILSQSS